MQPCRRSWRAWHPEFAIEAALLGAFMVSALAFTVLVEHPASPIGAALGSPGGRRVVIGLGMGATAIALIYSPWGRRSGAHMNPAATLAFVRLGCIEPATAAGYVIAQFAGAMLGVLAGRLVFGTVVADPTVRYAVTLPGGGWLAAFLAETAMTFVQLSAVLAASRRPVWRGHAGVIAAALVAVFIFAEAPISGMSLNPARTLASAVWAGEFTAIWIYFLAPALGMLLAAEVARHLHPRIEDDACSTPT